MFSPWAFPSRLATYYLVAHGREGKLKSTTSGTWGRFPAQTRSDVVHVLTYTTWLQISIWRIQTSSIGCGDLYYMGSGKPLLSYNWIKYMKHMWRLHGILVQKYGPARMIIEELIQLQNQKFVINVWCNSHKIPHQKGLIYSMFLFPAKQMQTYSYHNLSCWLFCYLLQPIISRICHHMHCVDNFSNLW